MKAPLHKTTALLSAFAACASILFLSQPAQAGPPFYRSGSGTRVSVGFYSGPSFRCGPGYGYGYGYPRYYGPPAYAYPVAPVYVAPPVYSTPYSTPIYTTPAPVYQGLPVTPSYSSYQQLAPSGSHTVAHVQEKLRSYGYYRGPVDGVAGSGTRSAIRSYQVDRGIQVTGRVDQELLSDLGL